MIIKLGKFGFNFGRTTVVNSAPGGAMLARRVALHIPWICQDQWFSREIPLWTGKQWYVSDTAW